MPYFCGRREFFSCNLRRALQPNSFSILPWGNFQMRYPTLVLSLICMIFTAGAASAEKRVAFVVGNGTYKNVAALPNPPIDSKAMASALRNVGFEVVEGTNLTRDKMTEKLLEFGKKAQGSDIAVF